ncbi:MAG TPA: hypothetical protein PK529_04520 [Verrucomicrobiales bacterium]|nr:hypothetical protein [Verrucomicrobiales bacterium]
MMKRPARNKAKGFTLIEMTLALAMTLGIAATLIGLIQQQVSFVGLISRFKFLRDEAPQINTLMTTIINKADSYRIYANLTNAKGLTGAIQTGGRALRLRLQNPDGTTSHAIISFETQNGKYRLNYYNLNYGETTWPTTPSWTISSSPSMVNFDNSSGVLLITMTGPNGDEITYAGNPD